MSTDTLLATLAKPGKYLSFVLGAEEFGLEILKVRDITSLMNVIGVSRKPPYVRGVIKLRGRVIPVVDLREKFAVSTIEDTAKTCIIVVEVRRQDTTVTMGTVVDEVSEVINFQAEQIEPAPGFGGGIKDAEIVTGVGRLGKKAVILLDVDRILTGEEIDAVSQVTPWTVNYQEQEVQL